MNKFFVLITDKHFGVFSVSAKNYPDIFLDNLNFVEVVEESDVKKFLIDSLGRNILIKKRVNLYTDIGTLFSRN